MYGILHKNNNIHALMYFRRNYFKPRNFSSTKINDSIVVILITMHVHTFLQLLSEVQCLVQI